MNSPDTETPDGLKWSGRRLWEATVSDYELTVHETNLLLQACRTVDTLDLLQAHVDVDGPVLDGPTGLRTHPGLVELRQQRIALARLLAALGLPTGVDDDKKTQRRSVRGVYQVAL
jgi:hypothetical protein